MFLLFNIDNPFKNIAKIFWKSGWYWDHKLTTHKFFEVETFVDHQHIFEFQLDLRFRGRDHAGPSISITLFSIGASARIYDHRHWDYEVDDWEDPYINILHEE